MLALLLSFNSIICYVHAEDFSGSSTDYGTPSNAKPITESPEYEKVQKNIDTVMKAFFTAIRPEYASVLWSNEISNFVQSDSAKDNNVTTDGNYYYISSNFINNINQKVQENIHALDGYYLFETSGNAPYDNNNSESILNYVTSVSNSVKSKNPLDSASMQTVNLWFPQFVSFAPYEPYINNDGVCTYYFCINKNATGFNSDYYIYMNGSSVCLGKYNVNSNSCSYYSSGDCVYGAYFHQNNYYRAHCSSLNSKDINFFKSLSWSGSPFRIFYSLSDLQNFLNNGRKYYAPKLPFSNIRIPVTYINNTNELPDFDFDFDKLIGKTENEIQNNIDATLKAYLDHLVKLNNTSSKPTPTIPAVRVTPTPDIGDRPITPSPTPPVTDDTSNTDKLLEQIYDWLLDFGDKHETFVELITQYIENTDGKLDQIIEAIDKLSQGSTEGEVNGCKYDYTVLSEFMTQLWNESDKKFDKMVELLEENNEYQQKIVDSLNQIKALLVADTVLDVFKNRSTETANKAKEKFPTSLPWDIAMVVNAFSATPKEPVIELPIKIASMHIDEKIVVDLSSEEWAKLAKTCRYLLSILFVLYMIHLSRKFFSKGDE